MFTSRGLSLDDDGQMFGWSATVTHMGLWPVARVADPDPTKTLGFGFLTLVLPGYPPQTTIARPEIKKNTDVYLMIKEHGT